MKHSRLGIASFLLSVITCLSTLGVFTLAVILHEAYGGHRPGRFALVVLLVMLFGIFSTNLVALGLGIAGMFQAGCKRVFAVIGSGLAALQIAATVLLIIVKAVNG